jgi:NADH-quinone oxidoreductase subunit J
MINLIVSNITFLIFLFFAGLALVSSVLIIVQKNPMHSVLYLAFAVLATAGVFFCLQAEFLGAVQITVYAGGIVVLYLFVIIIVNLSQLKAEKRPLLPKLFLAAVPLLLVAELSWLLLRPTVEMPQASGGAFGLAALGGELLSTYLIPFEIASVLLLAVLIGSIVVARKKVSQ